MYHWGEDSKYSSQIKSHTLVHHLHYIFPLFYMYITSGLTNKEQEDSQLIFQTC